MEIIRELTQEAEKGTIYYGTVRKIMDFGAFVEIFTGTDGLCHISMIAKKRIGSVGDVLKKARGFGEMHRSGRERENPPLDERCDRRRVARRMEAILRARD